MNSLYHAKTSVKKWGGKVEDYIKLHEFLDLSKVVCGDHRHRAMLHHTFGVQLACVAFGSFIVNSNGKQVPVREILEKHIIEDLGFLPSADKYLNNMQYQAWMSGKGRSTRGKTKVIKFEEL